MMIGYRSGFGYDNHGLVPDPEGRLIVGGAIVAEGVRAQAHSDGDVLIHSLIDGLLGAMNAGDIGEHFPDRDPRYKNISSLALLEGIVPMLTEKKAEVVNIDCTIILQEYKLTPYKETMKKAIAAVLNLSPDQINIKAKTKEGFDAVGRGEAVEAYTAVLLYLGKGQ